MATNVSIKKAIEVEARKAVNEPFRFSDADRQKLEDLLARDGANLKAAKRCINRLEVVCKEFVQIIVVCGMTALQDSPKLARLLYRPEEGADTRAVCGSIYHAGYRDSLVPQISAIFGDNLTKAWHRATGLRPNTSVYQEHLRESCGTNAKPEDPMMVVCDAVRFPKPALKHLSSAR